METDSQTQTAGLWLPERRGVGGLGERGEQIKKYKLAVTKQSQGYKIQHRNYSQ